MSQSAQPSRFNLPIYKNVSNRKRILKYLSYADRLTKLGLYSLELRRLHVIIL